MSLDVAPPFLPVRIISEPANAHDLNYMVELCADMKSGEVAVFDKAYVVYEHLHTLTEREIFWVTRAKENARFTVIADICKGSQRNIISDEVVKLTGKKSASRYPETMRRICARGRDSAKIFYMCS